MRRLFVVLVLAGLASVPVVATAVEPDAAVARAHATKQPKLKAFRSCAGLVRYARRNNARRRGPSAGPPPIVTSMPMPRSMPMREPAPAPGAESGPLPMLSPMSDSGRFASDDQTSRTNLQEAGVYEPDIVKTSRGRIFALAGGRLYAVAPGGPRLLGSLELDGFGHELLVHRDRVLVIGHARGDETATNVPPLAWPEARTVLTEVDVADPAAMRIVRTETVDGTYVAARRTGATARVVVSSRPRALTAKGLAARRAGWMPAVVNENAVSGRRVRRPLTSCRRVRRPAAFYSGAGMLSILTVDLSKGLPAVDADALMTDGQTVYASPTSLYVATPRWIPSVSEPGEPAPRTSTAIHSFDTSEHGVTRYAASGRVRGHLLNQFSLSEHGGFLRVASTDAPAWWAGVESGAWSSDEEEEEEAPGESFVTVLRRRSASLAEVGRVGGLGRGERIYAVRFAGAAAYVVTFRQTDPLYTIDLAEPERPRVRGELKLLGYSAYLHPIGDDLLIGVGQDADRSGRIRGTQISLFDVSDLSRPRRIRHHVIDQSRSTAEQDHHAFLWWPAAKLAVLPLEQRAFTGAVGYRIERGAPIAETGRASHGAADGRWPIERAFVVGGRLFTLSELGIEVNDLATLAERGWLPFPQAVE